MPKVAWLVAKVIGQKSLEKQLAVELHLGAAAAVPAGPDGHPDMEKGNLDWYHQAE